MATPEQQVPESQVEQEQTVMARLDQVLANQALYLTTMTDLGVRVTDIDTRQQNTAAAAAQAVAQANRCLQEIEGLRDDFRAAQQAQALPQAPAEALLQAAALPQAQAAAVQTTTTGPVKCAIPKPERYSGDSQRAETAHNWASTMTTYLDINQLLTSPEGPKHAGMFFTGSAASWWYSLTESNPQPFANWQEMKAAFLDYFSSTRKGKDAFRRLTNLEQQGNIRDYAKRFRDEVLQVDSGLLTPESKLFYFISGLKVDLRTHVETLNPATYDEAVRIAEAADSAQSFSSRARRPENREQTRTQHSERRGPAEHVTTRERTTQREVRHPGAQRPPLPRQDARPPQRHNGPAPMELGAMRTGAVPRFHNRGIAAPGRAPARQGN